MAEEKGSAGLFAMKAHTALANDLQLGASTANLADQQKQLPSSQIEQTASPDPKAEEIDSRYLVSPFRQSYDISNVVGRVQWNSPSDPENPRNWSQAWKWTMTIFVSLGGFVTMMSGSMIAPALPSISKDLHMSPASAELSLSIFILAFAFGPLALAPLTEVYGRRPIWLISGVVYSIWNVVGGFSKNKGTLISSRLFSGFGGSVDFVIAYPVRGDVWSPDEQGKAFSISTLIPLLGPAMGPLLGGIITQYIGWSWIFWTTAIFNSCLVGLGIFTFPETSGAKILGKRAKGLSKETGEHYHTEYSGPNKMTLYQKLILNLQRPSMMLATQPVLQVVSVLMAFDFGVLYMLLSTFSQLYTEKYHQSTQQSGFNYLAFATGYIIANLGGGLMTDALWAYLKAKANGSTAPEYRVPLLNPGGLLISIGLFMYGWSAQARSFWLVPDIGIAIFGCGFLLHTNALLTYILDSFEMYTASAMAASRVLRMLAGFAFPIFAPAMYARLGWGWGCSVFGFVGVGIGILGPFVLWLYGARLRAAGRKIL